MEMRFEDVIEDILGYFRDWRAKAGTTEGRYAVLPSKTTLQRWRKGQVADRYEPVGKIVDYLINEHPDKDATIKANQLRQAFYAIHRPTLVDNKILLDIERRTGIKLAVQMPLRDLDRRFLAYVKMGIDICIKIMGSKDISLEELRSSSEYAHYSIQHLFGAIIAAFQSNTFQILDYNSQLERVYRQQIMGLYPMLTDAIIVPSETHWPRVLKVDLVAFAAMRILMNLPTPKSVALGPGYTIRRLIDLMPASGEFSGTVWTSLVCYKDEADIDDGSNITVQHAYYRQRQSRYKSMPFLGENAEDYFKDPENPFRWLFEETPYAFLTVFGRETLYTTSPYARHRRFQPLYKQWQALVAQYSSDTIPENHDLVGWLLGLPLNNQGQVPFDELKKASDNMATKPDLEVLKAIASRGTSWLVAEDLHKVDAVHMSIVNGYTNAIIIDRSLALALINRNQERKAST